MDTNVIRDGSTNVYSDGEDRENAALHLAELFPGDKSEEAIANDKHYMPNYTFSSVRQNILNWYPFKKDAEILEVGAGMGAITGALISNAKHVTSVELSDQRAKVIRARFKDVNNLTIITENINSYYTEKRFDYVVIIGALEYAEVFSDAQLPYNEFLESATKFLKEDGVVLCAIENRFGIKYWCGSSEDHLFKPFVGLEGYKGKKTPRTFSKNELSNIFANSGFEQQRFYYPLPDYKFPQAIFTDESLPSQNDIQSIHFTYHNTSLLSLDERELYKSIIENNVFGFFANSFLIEASKRTLSDNYPVRVNAHSEKKQSNRVLTSVYHDKKVIKKAAHPKSVEHLKMTQSNIEYLESRGINIWKSKLENNAIVSDFCEMKKADTYFEELINKNDLLGIKAMIDKLRDVLTMSSEITQDGNLIIESGVDKGDCSYGAVLKKGFVDCVFTNCFYDGYELYVFDQEFVFDNVPLKCILYYAVNTTYRRANIEKSMIKLENLLEYISVTKEEADAYDRFSDYIWGQVRYKSGEIYGADGDCNTYHKEITLSHKFETFELEIKSLHDEIDIRGNVIEFKEEELLNKNQEIEHKERIINNYISELNLIRTDIEAKETELRNKTGHIELLLESERNLQSELNTIKSAKLFKPVAFIWKVEYKLFPINSRKRLVISMLLRSLRHPIRTMKKMSISRIKNFFNSLKEQDVKEVSAHFDECIGGHSERVEILGNYIKEIKSIEECDELIFEEYNNPKVSIIIPVYNQFSFTYSCLQSILTNCTGVEYEIILADDNSTDTTINIEQKVKNIKVIRNKENMMFLKNCNNAAKSAVGEYIVFLNNDTQVQPNWLKSMVSLMEKRSDVGMTGSKLVYPDGKLQEAGGILWKDGSAWNYGNGKDPSSPEFNYLKEVDYISGASLMIRKSLWEKIGGFDERFTPAYCEDSDLAFEVRKNGFKVIYQPKSVVIHFEGISNGTNVNAGIKHYQVENSKKFCAKWENELRDHYHNGTKVFRARERSKSKKVILMVDHYVPHIDQDAGSKTIYQYLQMFVDKDYVVKFIGDNFYQHEPYTSILQEMGIEVLYGNYYANNIFNWIKNNKDEFDFAFLNRPHISVKYIDFLKQETCAKIMYYGHDLHFVRSLREFDLTGEKSKLKESNEWKEKEISLMKKADISYYPSENEIDEIHKIDANISVKAITAYIYDNISMEPITNFVEREGIMFVGGFGHGPNHDAVQWFISEIWPNVYEKTKTSFYIVGSKVPNSIKKFDGENGIIVKGFVSDEDLIDLYNNVRVIVVPLRYGAGVKGKVVEAMSHGVPVITTNVGIEGIECDTDVIVVEDDSKIFSEKLVQLYNDRDLLCKISKYEKEIISRDFSMDSVWRKIENDFC